ncbi:hypothetical protein MIMGU_mgv1a021172mg, partial [Erythranthe guttata]
YSPDLVFGPSIFDEYHTHPNYDTGDFSSELLHFDFDFDYDGDFTLPFDMDFEYGYGDGLSDEIISKYLQTKRVSSWGGDGINNIIGEICVVCQDELCQLQQNETVIAALDFCGHEYHFDCIKQWLQQKNTCPLCKAQGIVL